jgi:hypothetical protein
VRASQEYARVESDWAEVGRARACRNVAGRPGDANAGVALAGNFYPAVARAVLRDGQDGRQLSILSQATHAATSLASGALELLLHRRCSRDDARGMNEPLDDTDRVTSPLRVIFDAVAEASRLGHRHVTELAFPPTPLFGRAGAPVPLPVPLFRGLKADLPDNVQLVSANPRDDGRTEHVTWRLLHPFEAGEHPLLSVPVTVPLDLLDGGLALAGAEERTLTLLHQVDASPPTNITLSPMQIRTFVLDVAGALRKGQ